MTLHPALYIGAGVFPEAKAQGFHLVSLDASDLKEFLGEIAIAQPRDLFLTDFSHLSHRDRSILLKFVEDYKGRVILFSSDDIFTEVLLSRFKFVKKAPVEVEFEEGDPDALVMREPRLYPAHMLNTPISRKVLRSWKSF